jgi:hypothetical protein
MMLNNEYESHIQVFTYIQEGRLAGEMDAKCKYCAHAVIHRFERLDLRGEFGVEALNDGLRDIKLVGEKTDYLRVMFFRIKRTPEMRKRTRGAR